MIVNRRKCIGCQQYKKFDQFDKTSNGHILRNKHHKGRVFRCVACLEKAKYIKQNG